jgi:hypothetical protein
VAYKPLTVNKAEARRFFLKAEAVESENVRLTLSESRPAVWRRLQTYASIFENVVLLPHARFE